MTTQPQPPESRSTAFLLVGIQDGGEKTPGAVPGAAGEQMSFFDGGAPTPAGLVWRAFTGDHDPGDARRRFEARYGQPPARVFLGLGGLLLAGPVPSEVLL